MSRAASLHEPSDYSNYASTIAEEKPCLNTASNAASLRNLVNFMNQDPDLWIFQHFNRLNLYQIVYLQQHLADLERRMDEAVPENLSYYNRREVERLMPDIESSLKKYEDAIAAQVRHKTYQKPSPELVFIMRKFYKNKGLDLDRELVLGQTEEMDKHVSIAAGNKGWIHKLVDKVPFLRKRFVDPKSVNDGLPSMLIYSESRIRRAEMTLINIGFCFLLLCPILILSYLENKALRLGIGLLFILVLSTLTIDLAESANRTSVALVAGYAAILVVVWTTGPIA